MPDPVAPVAADVTDTPTPGWAQRSIAVGLAVLGALPSSGLFGPASPILKVAGLVIVGLAALGYGNHSVTLKKAHAAGVAAGADAAGGAL